MKAFALLICQNDNEIIPFSVAAKLHYHSPLIDKDVILEKCKFKFNRIV